MSATGAAKADSVERVDVAIFNNTADKDKADEIKDELKGLDLRVTTSDDLLLGGLKFKSLISRIQNSYCNVFIITDKFVTDSMNEVEAELAMLDKIKSSKPKIIPVDYCAEEAVPAIFAIFNGINARDNSAKAIAKGIKDNVEYNKKIANNVVEVPVKDWLLKCLMMIDEGVDALTNHFNIDTKMKELHQKMADQISISLKQSASQSPSTGSTGCSCTEGEMWKKEISEKKYWSTTKPEPFRNIGKGVEGKHTDDIHQLYGKHGYLKLASVFLTKRPIPEGNFGNISHYLDNDGILQLLARCFEFEISAENQQKILEIRDCRTAVAHCKMDMTGKDQKLIDYVSNTIKDSLYGLLSRQDHQKRERKIDQIKKMEISAIEKGTKIHMELMDQTENHICDEDCPDPLSSLQSLRLDDAGSSSPPNSGTSSGPTTAATGSSQ